MRILYDASPLLMRSAGAKHYHHTLLTHLLPIIKPHRLRLFPRLQKLAPNQPQRSNYPAIPTALRLGGLLLSNHLGVPLKPFRIAGADLFHVTSFPRRLPPGLSLTSFVHDPTPHILPSCHTASTVRYFRYFIRETLPRLQRIAVPSDAVKRDLVRNFGLSEEKISVIYHGVSEGFFHAPPAAAILLKETYGLPQNYILSVGTMEPRKNLQTLVRAHASLRKELRRMYPLVIAGAAGWKSGKIRSALSNTPDVRLIGYVRPALLPALYHSASLFVMPSLYEGFGMPLLEAMAACLPIVASNWSAIPEVVGEAGLLIDPHSPHELTNAMESILDTPRLSSALAEAGRQRARAFTWETTAQQTKAFFEEALGS